jgi:hypothetical protein
MLVKRQLLFLPIACMTRNGVPSPALLKPFYGGLRGQFPCFAPMRPPIIHFLNMSGASRFDYFKAYTVVQPRKPARRNDAASVCRGAPSAWCHELHVGSTDGRLSLDDHDLSAGSHLGPNQWFCAGLLVAQTALSGECRTRS